MLRVRHGIRAAPRGMARTQAHLLNSVWRALDLQDASALHELAVEFRVLREPDQLDQSYLLLVITLKDVLARGSAVALPVAFLVDERRRRNTSQDRRSSEPDVPGAITAETVSPLAHTVAHWLVQ